ncbi:MAG TPA: hypothetical protein VGD80_12690 [Kofleriaceae bacterium]
MTRPDRAQIDADLGRLRYLLDELRSWSEMAVVDKLLHDRLARPYELELVFAGQYLEHYDAAIERPEAPRCHESSELWCPYCPDCGTHLPSWRERRAAEAREEQTPALVEPPPLPAPPPPIEPPPLVATSPTVETQPLLVTTPADVAEAVAVAEPRRARRLLHELRPVFYENLILFLGAFLMFAGSIYFAVYFWDRFGLFGPLVAGGLLGIYGLGFAGVGYLLQRRYQAELSARVLYAVATAILPVASTLLGAPIHAQSPGIAIAVAGVVLVFGAATYPAILVAASLFQREIGKPFARCFVALQWAVGLAPVVAASGIRGLAIAYVYLGAVPALAMYRRVREVGRVFERATVIYVVGGSAYLIAAVAVRMSLAMSPGMAPAELAPLLILVATAAIDLDAAWRERSYAARSVLGVVGVLAHGAAMLAIVVAFVDPRWRVLTTLSAGLVFGVTALRHRRPSAVHLAIAIAAAGGLLVAWMPVFDPPHGVALGGVILLPLSAGLARLGARWRRHAAIEFASPCELWAMLCPIVAALCAGLTMLGASWQLAALGRWRAYAPALIVLPASAAVLALAWSWGRRRIYLAASAVAVASTALVAVRMAGAGALGLALASAVLALGLVGGAIVRRRGGAADASEALIDAALVLLATDVVLLGVAGVGPWRGVAAAASAAGFALTACAAIAVASQRPRREIGVVAVLGLTMTAASVLWEIVPHELIPGIVALLLLALDRTSAEVAVGRARPLRHAYEIALIAVVLQLVEIIATTAAPTSVSPLASSLVALSLLAIAARHRSPWPTYGAVASLLVAAYGVPAALGLAVRPRVAAEAAGLAVVVIAVALRGWPRLRSWRTTFLDVPLHLTAAVAPLAVLRLVGSFAIWGAVNEAPQTYLLLRRLAPAIAFAVLAAFTHGSRVHAYLAAAASVFIVPAVAAALGLGLGGDVIAPAFAGAAVVALIGRRALARPAFAASVTRGDFPLRLFGYWPLRSAATHRDLWLRPIGTVGLVAALAAGALALQQALAAWPAGSAASAATWALLTIYAVVCCIERAGDGRVADRIPPIPGHTSPEPQAQPDAPSSSRSRPALAAHAACAAVALLCAEAAPLLGRTPHGGGLVLLGSAFLVLGELFARIRHPAARPGARAALEWAIALLLIPTTLLVHLAQLATPCAAAVLAIAVIRYRQRYPMAGARTAASIATTAASGFVVLWILGQLEWLAPEGVATAALAVTAALAAWVHWWIRRRANLGVPVALASLWAVIAALLAAVSSASDVPASAPAVLPAVLAVAALLLVTTWFGFAAIRTGRDRHGHAAQAALVVLYIVVRTGPLGAGLRAETDAIVAIAAAFALHFLSELLQRAKLAALERPAVLGARTLPVAACAIVIWLASAGRGDLSTVQHAVLAETLGVLYTLGARRTGHRGLGLVAIAFYNLGLALLWVCTDRRDPLYYVVPLGISISLLARIYHTHLSRGARRGLRAAGSLVIYFATYYQVVQFDHGLYPLLLGGFTLAGIALGFALRLRELFVLSIGFLVLDVISNLAYYGVHRPVLGWTLLTVAGLLLTVSGIVFQLRRAQVRGFVSGVRATLADWD